MAKTLPKRERNEFTAQDDSYLAQYIARYNPGQRNRTGGNLYQRLVENKDGRWPFASRHTWQSWLNRYKQKRDRFDRRIEKIIQKNLLEKNGIKDEPKGSQPLSSSPVAGPSQGSKRTPFTNEDKMNLVKYLARENAGEEGGRGNDVYKRLTANRTKWEWAGRHSWSSWRGQYIKHMGEYDERIEAYLEGLEYEDDEDESRETNRRKRAKRDSGERERKRRRVERESVSSASETEEEVDQLTEEAYHEPAVAKEEEEENSFPDEQQHAGGSGGRWAAREEEQAVEAEEEGEQAPPGTDDVDDDIFEDRSDEDGDEEAAAMLLQKGMSEDRDDNEERPLFVRSRSEESALSYMDPESSAPQDTQPTHQPISQEIPSPETLKRMGSTERGNQEISQEPTPPASDAPPSSPALAEQTPNGDGAYRRALAPTPSTVPPDTSPARPPLVVTHKRKRAHIEVEVFASSPSREPPSNDRTPAPRKREPPTLVEGAFNHAFTDAAGRPGIKNGVRRLSGVPREDEASSEDDENEVDEGLQKPWPPNRSRHKGKEKAADPSSSHVVVEQELAHPQKPTLNKVERIRPPTGNLPPRIVPNMTSHRHPFSQPTQEASQVMRPPPPATKPTTLHHPFSQPTQETQMEPPPLPHSIIAETEKRDDPLKISESKRARLEQALAKLRSHGPAPPHPPMPSSTVHPPAVNEDLSPHLPITGPSDVPSNKQARRDEAEIVPKSDAPALIVSPARPQSPPSAPPRAYVDRSVQAQTTPRFLSPEILADKGKQRAMDSPPAPVPRPDRRHTIDVSTLEHQQHPLHTRPSLPSVLDVQHNTSSDTSSLALRSSASSFKFGGRNVTENDSEIAMNIGMKHSLLQIAENHKFQYDVAFEMWKAVGNLKETDELLGRMRDAAQREADESLQMRRESKGDEMMVDQVPVAAPAPMMFSSSSSLEYNLTEAQNRHINRPPMLKYQPAELEDAEYRPPSDSRAALFVRWTEEGRIEEAKKRDHNRRQSGIMPPITPYKSR